VYVVSVVGITGERAAVSSQVGGLVARLRGLTDLPLCVGFGVSKPEHVREMAALADGVIVGTALVRKLEAGGDAVGEVSALVRELAAALPRP
jgi:tryptophan synthase alpha chain